MGIKIRISKEKFEVDGEDISKRIHAFSIFVTGEGVVLTLNFYCYQPDGKRILHDAAGPVFYPYKYLNPDIEFVHDGIMLAPGGQN